MLRENDGDGNSNLETLLISLSMNVVFSKKHNILI